MTMNYYTFNLASVFWLFVLCASQCPQYEQCKGTDCLNRDATRILIIGGSVDSSPDASMEYFWPEKPECNELLPVSLLTARASHASVVLRDGTVLIVGGWTGSFYPYSISSTEIFNPVTMQVKAGKNMTQERQNPAAALLDNVPYICGGMIRCSTLSSCQVETSSCEFLTDAGDWRLMEAPMPARRSSLALVVVATYFYAFGGDSSDPTEIDFNDPCPTIIVNESLKFDATTSTWSYAKPMPVSAARTSAAVLDGNVFTCGGVYYSGNACLKYEPKSDQWSTVANMTKARYGMILVSLNQKLYASSGDTVEVYNPSANKWDLTDIKLKIARYGHSAVVL